VPLSLSLSLSLSGSGRMMEAVPASEIGKEARNNRAREVKVGGFSMGEKFYKEICMDGFVGDSLYGGSFSLMFPFSLIFFMQ